MLKEFKWDGMCEMAKRILFLTVYFLFPVLLIIAILFSNPSYYGTAGLVPMVLGAAAFTLLNMQLILSARPKWVERYFGLDRFYQFHGIIAVIAIITAFIHKLIMGSTFQESFKTQLGDIAIGIFIFAAVMSLIFMADTLPRLFKPIRIIRDYFIKWKFTKHNLQLLLHNINLAAVVLIFIHVMLSSSAQNILVKSLYILYFGTAIGFYLYHKIIRKHLSGSSFTVGEVIHESESMTTLVLSPKKDEIFSYIPGQFGFLRISDKAVSLEEHPFSISSSPLNRQNVTVTIKNLGDWTSGVKAVQPGSQVSLDAPYGRFSPILYHCDEGIVLIAGGIGITPMLSILRYYAEKDKEQKIILLWGLKNRDEMICAEEFNGLQIVMPNFCFVPVMSGDPKYSGEKGHITKDLIQRKLEENGFEVPKLHFFFCGPPVMWPGINGSLIAMHVEKRMIHRENFAL